MILAVNLLNVFYLRLGLLLDVAWRTNLLATLTVLGTSRAEFLDPALPWRAMIDRLRLPVAMSGSSEWNRETVWKDANPVPGRPAFHRLSPMTAL